MKTKITILIAAVSLVTLSFTFSGINNQVKEAAAPKSAVTTVSEPVGGLLADEVAK